MTASTLSFTSAPWLDAKAAASFLGVHVDDLYKLVAEGVVPARRIGRRWRFVPAELALVGQHEVVERPVRMNAQTAIVLPSTAPERECAPAQPAPRRKAVRLSARAQLTSLDPYAHLKAS